MMTKCLIIFLLSFLLVYNAQADTKCNLRAVFKTPKQSDYDEFELMERSNFQSDEPRSKQSEPNMPNTFSNARVLLRLGDYKNAVKKNNNNVNTKITLAGPNHNNYYQPPFVHPYYPPIVPPMTYPWNLYYSNPRIPQYYPPYYIVNPSRYLPQYPVIPPSAPPANPSEIVPKPTHKQKILINQPSNQPIVLDNSVIQRIPFASIQPKSSASNGLNTMTVIPKILIDTVAKQPAIIDKLENEKVPETPQSEVESTTTTETSSADYKVIDVEEPKTPEVQQLKIEEIQPNTQNLTDEEPVPIEISPDQITNIPKEDQIIELAPADTKSSPPSDSLNVPEADSTIANPGAGEKEPVLVVEQEISMKEIPVEPLKPEIPTEDNPIHNINHPRVLHPVKLSNNIENVEIVGAGNVNVSLAKNSKPNIESCTNTKDDELVNLLKKSLVPFINLKTNEEPKLLVSYPIINNFDKNIPEHPSAIIVETLKKEPTFCAACANLGQPRRKDVDIDNLNIFKIAPMLPEVHPNYQESSSGYSSSSYLSSQIGPDEFDGVPRAVVSGYQISSGSGYYEDPTKRIVYKKPTEITVVPSQIAEDVTSFIPSMMIPQESIYYSPQHMPTTPNEYRTFLPPRRESSRSHSDLFDFMRYLLGDLTPNTLVHSRPSICPYCANMIRIPTVVRCPHCHNYHDVSRAYTSPEAHRSFCLNCMESGHPAQHSWNIPRLPVRCPYCAKYKGELNQLEA